MKKELVVKDNVLIEASYNLDLVEQRLILLAIIEARESGKGINARPAIHSRGKLYQSIWRTSKWCLSSFKKCV